MSFCSRKWCATDDANHIKSTGIIWDHRFLVPSEPSEPRPHGLRHCSAVGDWRLSRQRAEQEAFEWQRAAGVGVCVELQNMLWQPGAEMDQGPRISSCTKSTVIHSVAFTKDILIKYHQRSKMLRHRLLMVGGSLCKSVFLLLAVETPPPNHLKTILPQSLTPTGKPEAHSENT